MLALNLFTEFREDIDTWTEAGFTKLGYERKAALINVIDREMITHPCYDQRQSSLRTQAIINKKHLRQNQSSEAGYKQNQTSLGNRVDRSYHHRATLYITEATIIEKIYTDAIITNFTGYHH